MKHHFSVRFFPLLFLLFPLFGFGQDNLLPVSEGPLPTGYENLLKSNREIRENDILNEQLIDLVDVYLTDSILTKRYQRHHVFGGAIIPMFGFRWKTINFRKEKWVGTNNGGIRIPGDPKFTEYDVNMNITPHLKRYIDLAFQGYMVQREMGRQKKKRDYEAPPYVYPDRDTDLKKYKLHCELTPPIDFAEINEKFYPVIRGMDLIKHPNIQDNHFSLGMYGAFISDCNHSCHPEIHPYEWLWWLKTSEDMDATPQKRVWLAGLFREGSNRFPKWSPAPRTGEISIPFVFPDSQKELTIVFEHLVRSNFSAEGFKQLDQVPEMAQIFVEGTMPMALNGRSLSSHRINVTSDATLPPDAIKWWIDEVNYDASKKLISGRLHIAASVEWVYNARVTIN